MSETAAWGVVSVICDSIILDWRTERGKKAVLGVKVGGGSQWFRGWWLGWRRGWVPSVQSVAGFVLM